MRSLPNTSTHLISQFAIPREQGVPTCGNGLFFERVDALVSAKTFCERLFKDWSWTQGVSQKFGNIKIYNNDGTTNPDHQFSLQVNADAAWCPEDLNLDELAKAMTLERCVVNMMIGVDGCAPFVAPDNGKFLKTVGSSFKDCISWQVGVVEA